MHLLRQSWNSNYCGVYAVGTFLSHLGVRIDRRGARKLFGLQKANGSYEGTTPAELLAALIVSGAVYRPRWKFFRRLDLKAIKDHFARTRTRDQLPSILYFGIIHRRRGEKAMHYTVITECGEYGLRLLDPLGREPRGQTHNVSLTTNSQAPSHLPAIGCPYLVDMRSEAGLLLWQQR